MPLAFVGPVAFLLAFLLAAPALAQGADTLPTLPKDPEPAASPIVELAIGTSFQTTPDESDWRLELAVDLRVHAPWGLGALLRIGPSVAIHDAARARGDLGVAYRWTLVEGFSTGLDLTGGFGVALTLPAETVLHQPGGGGPNVGGFALLELAFRFGRGVLALAALGRFDGVERPSGAAPRVRGTLGPMLRFGLRWD